MRRHLVALALATAAVVSSDARADVNDLVLSRLARRVEQGGMVTAVIPQSRDLRALASQLGVVLAPHLLTPADTLGFGGVQFSVDLSTTQVDRDAAYWRAAEGSPDPDGTGGGKHTAGYLSTIGFFARKGMWFPAPAMELGGGAVHLKDSNMWAGQLYAKLALQEGYHDYPLPSLALRGAVSRLMTQRELDLTVISLDASLSKHIGILGTWNLNPYAGWNTLLIIPRSEVIDPTPEIDPLEPGMPNDRALNFVFKDQDPILRHRVFLGAKAQFGAVMITVEGQLALAGTSVDDRGGTSAKCEAVSQTEQCDAQDSAAKQQSLTISAGLEF
ncbi:MAG: hypothetical protein R3B48_25080 [Kofleriaceae bacterium]